MIDILVPAEGSIDRCIIGQWQKKPGDAVKTGDLLCTAETDKAVVEIVAPADGYLADVYYGQGDEAPTRKPIARIASQKNQASSAGLESTAAAPVQQSASPELPGRKLYSPRARRLAQEAGVDLDALQGSGSQGSVIESDVKAALKHLEKAVPPAACQEWEWVKPNPIRLQTARIVAQSCRETASFTLHAQACMTRMLDLRARLKAADERLGIGSVTISDMIRYAAVRSLKKYPLLNSIWADGQLHQYKAVNLGFAVSAPAGLLVPVIRGADSKSVLQLSLEAKRLRLAVLEGRYSAEDLSGGTFTISNLGPHGIISFTPILNYPQIGILGIGKPVLQPIRSGEGFSAAEFITLSLTADHQVIDGAAAADFLADLVRGIEEIEWLLLG